MKTHQKIDYNSPENQKIKEQFVQREVLACFSACMENIFTAGEQLDGRHGLPTVGDINNLYGCYCEGCGTEIEPVDTCLECGAPTTQEPRDIMEWWLVSRFLYEKLSAEDEPVLEWGGNFFWGRCTSGQAIQLDSVISTICKDSEILKGQANSWYKESGT